MLFVLIGSSACARSFAIQGDNFVMDGKPFRYVAGSFHYFRQHPSRWEDTIKKMAAGGLNAVQTYVPWNIHEPQKGNFIWDGFGNLTGFLQLAQKYNLYVILRPGPYICSEWEMGGYPWWLNLEVAAGKLRSSDAIYLGLVDKWYAAVLGKVAPFMYNKGGPVIIVQVENEYGSTGCDHKYMDHLANEARAHLGTDAVLITIDNAGNLECGKASGALATVDFGPGCPNVRLDPVDSFNKQRKVNGHGPDVCSEYWIGWADHWGERHHTTAASEVVKEMATVLQRPTSLLNMYMYYGGTDFYLTGGGIWSDNPDMQVTSYDYDAAISEAGDLTYKWEQIKNLLSKYRSDIPTYDVKNWTKKSYGRVSFTQMATLWEAAPQIANAHATETNPLTFEALKNDYGYVLYRATQEVSAGSLTLPMVHDRAYVYVGEVRKGLIERKAQSQSVTITAGTLDILVENMGRATAGSAMSELKGIMKGVQIAGKALTGWEHFAFNFSKIHNVGFGDTVHWGKPGFYRAVFKVDEIGETFLNPSGWTKGVAFINGFNIGRYWTRGPQITLYVPSALLKVGDNELIVFDADTTGTSVRTMSFDSVHQLGK
jgi:beta-galactosidase